MGDDLRLLPHAFDHARYTRGIMLQNVVLSIALIAVLIPLAPASWGWRPWCWFTRWPRCS